MRRADRLFQIVQYLRAGRLMTAAQLAERLEVTRRTIYRDVADLIGSGVPIEGEAGVGYVMRAGYDLPPIMFTAEEVVALVAGARVIRAWGGTQMARGAEDALSKIETVLPEAVRQRAARVPVHAFLTPALTFADRDRLDIVEAAAAERLRLTFDYETGEGDMTRRTIRPLGLWFWGRTWTILGWCELRDDFRTFRLDRMDRVETGEGFEIEPGRSIDDYAARQGHPPGPE